MVHFEFLIEDQSGAKAMSILIPKMLGNEASYKIHAFKGLGRIPKNLKPKTDASKRILLDQLPQLLQGYGRSPGCGTVAGNRPSKIRLGGNHQLAYECK